MVCRKLTLQGSLCVLHLCLKPFEKIFVKGFFLRYATMVQLVTLLKNELFYMLHIFYRTSQWLLPMEESLKWNVQNASFQNTILWLLRSFKRNVPLLYLLLLYLLRSLSFFHFLCLTGVKSLQIIHALAHLYSLHAWTFFKTTFSIWFFIGENLLAKNSVSSSLVS